MEKQIWSRLGLELNFLIIATLLLLTCLPSTLLMFMVFVAITTVTEATTGPFEAVKHVLTALTTQATATSAPTANSIAQTLLFFPFPKHLGYGFIINY